MWEPLSGAAILFESRIKSFPPGKVQEESTNRFIRKRTSRQTHCLGNAAMCPKVDSCFLKKYLPIRTDGFNGHAEE
jgi:hypothetical protein